MFIFIRNCLVENETRVGVIIVDQYTVFNVSMCSVLGSVYSTYMSPHSKYLVTSTMINILIV